MNSSALSQAAAPPARSGYRYYVLGVLLLVYVASVVDRAVLGLLLEPIKLEFGVSDGALGLLGGIAFAGFYATLGIPVAAWADRANRRNILAAAVAIWSLMTALCGLAASFTWLLLARAGTAVGEAGGGPPAQSLIADYFAPEKRATALSVYAMGATIGNMLGNLIGGWGVDWVGWRMTFILAGLPGVLIALLVYLTVRETPRGLADQVSASAAGVEAPGFIETVLFLWRRRAFRHMCLAIGLQSFAIFGGVTFAGVFFVRYHAMSPTEVGSWLAGFAVFATLGVLFGGLLADRVSTWRRDRRWYMWVPSLGALIIAPFQVTVFLHPSFPVVAVSYILMVIVGSSFLGPCFAMTQGLAALRMRAFAASILIFLQTLVGLGLGPTVAGFVSDALVAPLGDASLRYALVFVSLFNLGAALHYFLAARTLREDLDETAALIKTSR
jgi:MFS family permease